MKEKIEIIEFNLLDYIQFLIELNDQELSQKEKDKRTEEKYGGCPVFCSECLKFIYIIFPSPAKATYCSGCRKQCQCGGDKLKSTHSKWCPKSS